MSSSPCSLANKFSWHILYIKLILILTWLYVFWECVKCFRFSHLKEYIDEVIAECRRLNVDVLLCPMLGPAYNFHYCGRLSGTYLKFTLLLHYLCAVNLGSATFLSWSAIFFFICLVNHCVTSHVSLLLAFNSLIITSWLLVLNCD